MSGDKNVIEQARQLIDREIRVLDDRKARIQELVGPMETALSVAAVVPGAFHFATVVDTDATVYLNARDMADVTLALRYLAGQGFRQTSDPDDMPDQHSRLYYCGRIHVYVTFGAIEGATCRYVEVGKKEVPVYELRCGDGVEAKA